MRRSRVIAGLIGLAAAGLAAAPHPAAAAGWDASYFPDVTVFDQHGTPRRFYDDLVDGRIVVFNFIYTECPDICGLSTARLAQIAEWLGDRVGDDIFLYSISLDPATDTPAKLAEYARAFGVAEDEDGWLFLTGDPADLDQVRWKLGERSTSLSEHRTDMVLGNGATGEFRRASLMGSLQTATWEILEMDPGFDPPAAIAAAAGPDAPVLPDLGFRFDDRVGEALFLQACAACHSIGEGDGIGPDLAGVTLRRDPDWLVRYLMNPDGLRAAGDPLALALSARFPGVDMPDFGLGETDVADLMRYLRDEMDLLDTATQAAQAASAPAPHVHGADGAHDHGSAHDHAGHGPAHPLESH
jgi:protein SCO1/2